MQQFAVMNKFYCNILNMLVIILRVLCLLLCR